MKTIRYIFLTLAAATFVAACSEELNPNEINKANPGDEVQFGLSLPGKTKTVYGEETSTGFPIYWVNGDKVKVASPQCQSGRNNAEYSVSVESETQPYATGLTKTGDYGVQWGSAETADFYSIYPSTAGTALNMNGETVTAKLHVDATQFANTTSKTDDNNNEYFYSQPAEMGNVVMYAKTTVNRNNDEKTNGVVELHYTPFSTVLEFTLIAQSNGGNEEPLIIQSITLTAPTGTTIAGDFAFNFPTEDVQTPSIEAVTGGSNAITMHFLQDNQYNISLTPTKNTMKAKMCLMPISGVSSLVDWKVEVNTSAGTFIKTLKEADKNTALVAGKVHKITLPKLGFVSDEWVYDPGEWIPSLPDYRNIYLSELSLPGAWYAGSTESYQATSDIATLWKKGVRAFAVETKTTSTGKGGIFITYDVAQTVPNGIALSGTASNSSATYDLGTNTVSSGANSNGKVYYSGTSISDIITKIANAVNDTEYAVLVLSYADGGTSGLRPVDFGAWLKLLYDVYNNLSNTVKEKIYQKKITANTTVNDVLGKLILKINVDANIAMSGTVSRNKFTYQNNLPALFSYNPFLFQMSGSEKFSVPFFSNLSWSTWGDDTDTHRKYMSAKEVQSLINPFVWCFSSANRTQVDNGTDGTIPTYANRKAALGAMMKYSKQIYEASTHNVWFYLNCGGTQATSQTSDSPSTTAFAKEMNNWLLETINAKTDPSPLGIVMFNQCTGDNATYHGADIIKAIIEMNSRFYLKHAGTSGGNTGGSTGGSEDNTAQNDSSFEDGGEMF